VGLAVIGESTGTCARPSRLVGALSCRRGTSRISSLTPQPPRSWARRSRGLWPSSANPASSILGPGGMGARDLGAPHHRNGQQRGERNLERVRDDALLHLAQAKPPPGSAW